MRRALPFLLIPLFIFMATVTIASAATTVEVRVDSALDDVEEFPSGHMDIDSTDLEMTLEASDPQTIGLRFNGLTIPHGATITNAYIQFQADEEDSQTTDLAIQAEAIDNAPAFSSSDDDVSLRSRTTASVSWSPQPWTTKGEAGADQRTPDIAAVVQEVVNRQGWLSGNSFVIIITGNGKRVAESYEGDSDGAPLLHVEYTQGTQPVAVDDTAATNPDTPITVDVLANDTDPQSDPLTVSSVTQGASGSVVVNGDNTVTYTPNTGFSGTDSFTYTANDGTEDSNTATVTVTVGLSTIEIRVDSGIDDVEEFPSGNMETDSTDLEMTLEASDPQTIGLRFNGLTIPHGASITNAYIQFKADEEDSQTTSLAIQAEDIDNAPAFSSSDDDVTSRTRTTASVSWSPQPWTIAGAAGADQRTPDIATVIQEVVNRTGWISGNSLAIIITGNGKRVAESYEGDSSGAPLLHVEFTQGQQPVAVDDEAATNPDTPITIDVLANDTDAQNDPLTVSSVTQGANGSVVINGNNTVTYTPNTGFNGTDSFTYTANDGSNDSNAATVTITVGTATLEIRVNAALDDAEEYPSGNVDVGSNDLELTQYEEHQQTIGIRFNGLTIPSGATITNAYVQFKADEEDDEATSLTIQAEAIDNAPAFSNTDYDITSRTRTTASVPWSPVPWPITGQAGVGERTPDIAAVVQEVVDRTGWADGNSLVIIITGTGDRVAETYEGDSSGAPLLHVEYTQASPVNLAPVADAGADQTVTREDTVNLDGSGSSDPESNPLTYQWSFVSVPSGSIAALSDPAVENPIFTADLAGTYEVQLIVNDGTRDSDPDTVIITADPQTVQVPNVVDMLQADAQTAITGASLTVGTINTGHSSAVAIGHVISQDPAAAASVDEATAINLVVSLGPVMVAAPDVVGLLQTAAEAAIVGANLTVGTITTANSATVPVDQVISQNPTSGTSIAQGSPVDIVVSLGPAMVTVPDVVGQTQTNAEAAIAGAGLVVGTIGTVHSATVAMDHVISQDPASGASVAEGSIIDMIVSLGPVMVTVPDVAGQLQTNAESAITAANLTVGTISTANSSTVPVDHVISQNPAGGTSVAEGSPVDLVISFGTVSISAAPAAILQGESSTLTWSSASATSAFIDNGVGTVNPNDSVVVFPDHTTTYTITVTGSAGSYHKAVTVSVTGNPDPLPEGSFGVKYEDLIPPDATVDDYDPDRFSIITGLVNDLNDAPLAGVSISIHDQLEYGTVTTDTNGQFNLPVEGGSTITVVFQKDGFITAHRKVYVPWNDVAIAETIQLVVEDPVATTLTFDGNPSTVVTHQSSVVTDEFGSRSASMVFTGDNRAYLVDENGNDVHELTTITTRATEFTTPASMPAKLPPNSGYTYCVELAVDSAQRVRFEKPVVTWVDNFLGFDVGMAVPVGYYDRDRGLWVPVDNGVVVKLLDTDLNGIVDALDADGDDLPDDLDEDGLFNDEVEGLDDPVKYSPDSTYWRVAVSHFTPWDCNWPFGPPADSVPPNPQGIAIADIQKIECLTCPVDFSSYAESRSRIFHEDIAIPGTGIALHYASNRVTGYQDVITIPASGPTVPASLKNIVVNVRVAGRNFSQILDPLPDQKTEVIWDGLDYLGNPVFGPVSARVDIGFVYDVVYLTPRDLRRAFAQAGGSVTGVQGRSEVTSWKRTQVMLHRAQGTIADGWTMSPHHQISPDNPSALYKGDGSLLDRNNVNLIETIAGTGAGFSGDGGPADQAKLRTPYRVDVNAAGEIFIADTKNHRIRKIDADGIITTIAGTGSTTFSGDGGLAVNAGLSNPQKVVCDNKGNLYISDYGNNRVRKIDANGIITTVAGNGGTSYAGDGVLATQTGLYGPAGLAVSDDGTLYISIYWRTGVVKVDTDGIISTVAGGYYPSDVAVDHKGNVYIANRGRHTILVVDTEGVVSRFAGISREQGYSGDGGLAVNAKLKDPSGVATDSAGNVYIADTNNRCIRKVDTSGIITTVAGTPTVGGFSGDGGPATTANISALLGIAVWPSGDLIIADTGNNRIRRISIPAAFSTVLDPTDKGFADEDGTGYIFSGAGLHEATIDIDTGMALYTFSYNSSNQIDSFTDRFGNQTQVERDVNGVPTAIISPDGIRTELTIDSNNQLTRITYPDGSYYDFEYTPDGLMTAEIEPAGNRFDHAFSSTGRLTDGDDEEAGSWNYSRSTFTNGDILSEVTTGEGNVTSYLDHTDSTGAYTSTITGPTGDQTLFSQSADGLSVDKTLPCGMDLDFTYDVDPEYKYRFVTSATETTPLGLALITTRGKTYEDTDADLVPDLITETVTVNGKAATLAHNTLAAQKTVTSPEGRTVTSLYDPNTLLTDSVSVPGLFDTTYGYDARGRLTTVSTNTRQTAFAYNAEGFLDSITDPENQTTTYGYDAVGRITSITRPDSGYLAFTYDNNGNMTVLTNPAGIDHDFGFNTVNSNSSYTTPLSGSYSYVYDKDRRLIQTNFPSGATIINDYANPVDPADKSRLWQIQTPEGDIDFTYLCGTKIDSISKGSESITYTYDGKLVTSETLNGTLGQSIDYSYNNDFDVTSLTYAGASTLFAYDNDGLLTGAGNFTITRNVQNGLPEAVADLALNIGRTFNGYGEVDGQTHTVNGLNNASWTLVRDDNGRITQKTETVNGTTAIFDYTYDSVGRLLTVTKDSVLVEEYQYDSAGTRSYEMNSLRGIAGRSFTYSDEDHLLSAGSVVYNYDLDGFLTTKTNGSDVSSYSYSSRGELLSVTLPDGRLIEYDHDPLGRRIAKKINGSIVEKYLWQGLTRLLAVYDAADTLLMRFEYADGRMPVAMTSGGSTYYLSYDQVGSLRLVADSAGNMIKSVEYDSFGNIINDTNPTFAVPFGFAGGLHDRDTGLVRFGHRDYDADIGRWTAKDPIFFAGGDSDLYGYVLNDPVNSIDPWGLYDEIDFWEDAWTGERGDGYHGYEEEYWRAIEEEAKAAGACLVCTTVCTGSVLIGSQIEDAAVQGIVDSANKRAKRAAAKLAARMLKEGLPVYNAYSTVEDIRGVFGCVVTCTEAK